MSFRDLRLIGKVNGAMRVTRLAAGAAITCASTAAFGQSSEYGIDVRAGAGFASNPFVIPGGEAAGFLNLEILPEWRLSTERAITSVRGRLIGDAYVGGGGFDTRVNASATLEREERLTERLSYNGLLELQSSEGSRAGVGLIDSGVNPVLGGDSSPLPDIDAPDPDLLVGGIQQRLSVRAASIFRYRLSERDRVEAGANFSRAVYPGQTIFNNFNSLGVRGGYDRALNERTFLGARASAQWTDSEDTLGRFQVITPQVTAQYRLSEIWTIDGAVGGLFITSRGGLAPPNDIITVSGSLRACRRTPTSELCSSVLRDAATSGVSGVVQRTTVDAYYTRILDRDTRLQGTFLFGNFEEVMRNGLDAGLGDRTYWAATGLVERQIGERLFGTTSLIVEKANYEALGAATNFRFQISIAYRFGDLNNGRPYRSDR